jgi:hypothetical protein
LSKAENVVSSLNLLELTLMLEDGPILYSKVLLNWCKLQLIFTLCRPDKTHLITEDEEKQPKMDITVPAHGR